MVEARSLEKDSVWKKKSFLVLFLTIVLSFVCFYPLAEVTSDIAKRYLLMAGVFTASLLWLIQVFKDRALTLPRTNIYWGGLAILAVGLFSSFFSNSGKLSLVGNYFDTSSFLFWLTLGLLTFLCSLYFVSQKRVVNFYLGVLFSFFLVVLFQILVIFFDISWLNGPTAFFHNRSVNLLGSWNDLAIFGGFVALSTTIFLEYIPLGQAKIFKNILITALVLSLLLLVLVNFYAVWVVLSIFSLLLLIYNVTFGIFSHHGEKKNIFYSFSFSLAILSVVFAIFAYPSGFLNTKLNNLNQSLDLNYLEARPAFGRTMIIAQQVLRTEPLLGVGTNNFDQAWQKFKPKSTNATPFWNANFEHGYSLVTTMAINNGLLGLAAWLSFLACLLYAGFKALFFKKNDFSRAIILLVFASILYLWTMAFLYVSETAILVLLFALTGILIAILASAKIINYSSLAWVDKPNASFIAKNIAAVLVVGFGAIIYLFVTSAWSLIDYQRSIKAYGRGEVELADQYLRWAVLINPQDYFYRHIIDLDIAKLDSLLKNTELPKIKLVEAVQAVSLDLTNMAGLVTTLNPGNYLNYLWAGKVYEAMMNLGALGFYEKAEKSYIKAAELNPNNPFIYLSLARLEIFNKDSLKARQYLEKALALKSDYTEAILFEAQLSLQDGSFDEAVQRLEDALILSPDDIGAMFQLGYLEYQKGDYVSAAAVLSRLLVVSPNYSDARYFLGLAYDKLGNRTLALEQFVELKAANPNNQEISRILNNLNSGLEALARPTTTKMTSVKKK